MLTEKLPRKRINGTKELLNVLKTESHIMATAGEDSFI
jgi:hypothetical protein